MSAQATHEVTRLLAELTQGDREALSRLAPVVYQELHGLAERALRGERPGHTLEATALVHETYLRLCEQKGAQWRNRAQFFAVAAILMRRILVDHARGRGADKRGGERKRVALEDPIAMTGRPSVDLLAMDEALSRLAELDSQQSRIVELRFFGGLTIEETAEVLNLSPATVKRDWKMAKAWLFREIGPD